MKRNIMYSYRSHFHVLMFFRQEMDKVFCQHHPDAPLVEDYHAGDAICSECGLVVGDR